ncbi:MAG: SGNH/GDSL hydrolase family protein [Pseudomonadota bacterium]
MLIRIFLPAYNPYGIVQFHFNADGVPLATPGFQGRQIRKTGDFNVAVSINRYGFRDIKDLAKSTNDDLFVVGDSFSFGFGVEESERYSDFLQHLLGASVYNISIPTDFNGYDTLLDYAKQNGAKIRRLVIGVCMENDLGYYQTLELASERQTIKAWVSGHLAIYRALASIVHQNAMLNRIGQRIGLITPYDAPATNVSYSEEVISRSVNRLINLAKDYDSTILIIPSRGLWTGNSQENIAKTHEKFVALLKKAGQRVVDMAPILESGGEPLSYYYPRDGHWKKEAHTLAAEYLVNKLAR